jgi:hypothetical protein
VSFSDDFTHLKKREPAEHRDGGEGTVERGEGSRYIA